MLATRILPPQFLLPAWSAQQLRAAMQQEFHSCSRRRARRTPREPERNEGRRPTRKGISLFDELFPEERQQLLEASAELDKLPPFQWDDVSEQAATPSPRDDRKATRGTSWVMPERQLQNDEKRKRREASVLVLNAVTKNLEESDFCRMSPKGEHIEGWTSGIIKVIPARNPHTLESLGHYFILFSSDGAARAYMDQTIKLHTLAKTHVRSQGVLGIPPPLGFLKEGEDLQTILRGFSLVPASNKLSLRLISRPYRPAMVRLLSEGGPAAITSRQRKAEDMVLFSLEGGHVSQRDLSQAISNDGKRRNLHWRLAGGGAKPSGNREDIVGLGDGQASDGESHEETLVGRDLDAEVGQVSKVQVELPSRYIISFADRNEARRFVREWHRRPFPRQKGRSYGDEPPIVTAEILW